MARSAKKIDHKEIELEAFDPEVYGAIRGELKRQRRDLELIASENIVTRAVMEAQGSVMTNKYSEGYPGNRWYGGCEFMDVVETLAIERVKKLFGAKFANVQPHSGASANEAAFMALLNPGDTFMGLNLAAGGHLTHGMAINFSGKWFKAVSYDVDKASELVDYDGMEKLAQEHKPKMIIAGGSAYPRVFDFARMRQIADSVGAKLMVDMAHFAGLVAGGAHPSPFPHAHIVTSTTHKTLGGPRGGFILTNDEALAKKINTAVFPGQQGGPLMHVIAAKAVAFKHALTPKFRQYARSVVRNADALAQTLVESKVRITTGGTDTHVMLLDLQPINLTGKQADAALGKAHITVNKNGIPNDPLPPSVTSGIRLGSPALTTRGFGVKEFRKVGGLIAEVLKAESQGDPANIERVRRHVQKGVARLTERFPLYPHLG